ncbi:MAG: PilZ domain-containing protein [Treponema sp.]|nr:PilZ domain-containing protein [Treponema sp.]
MVGLGVVIVAFTIVNLIKAKSKSPVFTQGTVSVPKPQRRYSRSSIREVAHDLGLDKAQKKMLDFVMRNDNVSDPEYSLRTPELLDRHFRRAYRAIQRSAKSEEDVQEKLSVLYSTRNILEAVTQSNNITSTRQIADKTDTIFIANGKEYPVKVISSRGNYLLVEHPVNALGALVPLAQDGKVSLSFFSKSSRGFSVESRVAGLLNGPDGSRVQLFHSTLISGSSKRRFRRRRVSIPSSFYFVHLEKTGSRNETKLVVDKRKLSGNIMDISIGGCSILTKMSIPSGTRLKIEFVQDKTTVAALGQVLRTNRSGLSTIMHIKFLKISRKSLNAINTLVFEYADV